MSQPTTTPDQQSTSAAACPIPPATKSTDQLTEDEMRQRYLEQQARLACPGCGESPFLG